jgi:hypothetical protein
MNSKTLFMPLVAFLAILLIGMTSALASGITTEFNGVVLSSGQSFAGIADDVVPVRVAFVANSDAEDVKVRVWMEGNRDEIEASTSRFSLIDDVAYTKVLSLELPAEIKDRVKDFTLHVSISSADEYDTETYDISMQRESYNFKILSVDYPTSVSAGQILPVSVVVENTGMQELEDGFVLVTIPELDISAKGYFGDLVSVDQDDDDSVDSVQKTVFLSIPINAEDSVYNLKVRVYNSDASTSSKNIVRIEGSAGSNVVASARTQELKAGETKTYDLVLINSGNSAKTYSLNAVAGNFLSVSVPSVVTVGPESSKTVPVSVSADSDSPNGAYTFSVDVDGQEVILEANVSSAGVSSAVALTVVLVIVFVVLLVVLIVLLTRREKPIEEVETSYY